jgi:hypothetical protein
MYCRFYLYCGIVGSWSTRNLSLLCVLDCFWCFFPLSFEGRMTCASYHPRTSPNDLSISHTLADHYYHNLYPLPPPNKCPTASIKYYYTGGRAPPPPPLPLPLLLPPPPPLPKLLKNRSTLGIRNNCPTTGTSFILAAAIGKNCPNR